MAEAESPFAEVLGDQMIMKINKQHKRAKFSMDDTLQTELQEYIIFAKPNRKPFEPKSAEDLKRLIREMHELQSYRDRITGIFIQTQILIDELTTLISTGEAYLFSEYGDVIKKKCTNDKTREAAIRYIFGPVVRKLEDWKSLKKTAEMAKINLNDTYFVLHEIGANARAILNDRKVRNSFDA
ncbi:unnamed protein product [marine sediment metagenome]|uniref:Uncharacterized protein n=1 Tax=marine sediment metagenome TaxID=412755 RepID=X0UG65_9ZZZZ